jgi:hypothetical protein
LGGSTIDCSTGEEGKVKRERRIKGGGRRRGGGRRWK